MAVDERKKKGLICPACFSEMRLNHLNSVFAECSKCGVVQNTAFSSIGYEDTYFTKEYASQYGRSYEEDFEKIYSFAKNRILPINTLLNKRGRKARAVCDVGCALGFFLKACEDVLVAETDARYFGVEISEYASRYCEGRFGYTVYNGDFLSYKPDRYFDVITAWYCVEHFEDPFHVLEKMSGMMHAGGVIGLSFPSPFGPEKIFHAKRWFDSHPEDHSYDFSPRSLRIILKRCGFSDIVIRPASFHPERIISKRSFLFPFFSLLFRLFSRITAFSDTIEAFAIKR